MHSRTRGFFHSRKIQTHRRVLPVIFLLLVGATGFFFILRETGAVTSNKTTITLNELWQQQEYQHIIETTNDLLIENPLSSNYLFYNGISNFYHAISLVNYDERQTHLDAALYSLRKLYYAPPIGYEKRISYMLGKIYFHKGIFYYDLAEKYLSLAEQSALKADDIVEHLGVIYLETNRPQTGITYLLKAIADNPRDVLYYTVATAYEDTGALEKALEYYQTCIGITEDQFLIQEARIGQGRVRFAMDDLVQAKQIFQQVIDNNIQLAEGYFYLGEIYAREDDMVKARANWREAYNLDKTFTPAIERLNS